MTTATPQFTRAPRARRKYTPKDEFPEDLVERCRYLVDVGKKAGQRWVGENGVTYLRRVNTMFENTPLFPDGIQIGETVVMEKGEDGKFIESTSRLDVNPNQIRALAALSRGGRYLGMQERLTLLAPYRNVQQELRRHGKPGVKVQEEVMGQILALTENDPKLRDAFLAAVTKKEEDPQGGDALVNRIVDQVIERLSNARVDADGRLIGDAASLDPEPRSKGPPPPRPKALGPAPVETLTGSDFDDSEPADPFAPTETVEV